MQRNQFLRKKFILIMNVTLVMAFSGIMHAYADYAAEKRITVRVKDGTFYDVISQIEKQSNFMFFYSSEEIDNDRKVTLVARNKLVSDVLSLLLKGQGLTWRIDNTHIVISKAVNAFQQQNKRIITGIVRDASGEPVIGATVLEKGVDNGTATDSEGKFTLAVSETAILQISYVGFKPLEISTLGGG